MLSPTSMKATKKLEDGSQIASNIYPCLLGTDSQNEVLNVLSDKKVETSNQATKKMEDLTHILQPEPKNGILRNLKN